MNSYNSRLQVSASHILSRGGEYLRRLCESVRAEYRLDPIGIAPAPRGYYGETWRLECEDRGYFLKLDYTTHKDVYARSFLIIDHLWQNGINFISHIVKTVDGRLFTNFEGAVLGIFDWIDGTSIETDATKPPEYDMLARVYAVPVNDLDIPRAKFSDESAERFFTLWEACDRGGAVDKVLEGHRGLLEQRARKLRRFACECKNDTSHFYLTHGDAGGNLLVNGDDYRIIDWDDALLAPPERDAWVMCCSPWARTAFNEALRRHRVEYALRPERLAYYCYHMFFFYLTAFLEGFTKTEPEREISEYFDGWIEERIHWADGVESEVP
ncbi:MAG: aminoglycoside phosphotransferase family protein [Clostridiales bacterium]|nr:aminoglycoside phosphotransferase family protein [Clostridiales bacterium]